jgi:large subunit ribosomal protein L9
MSKSSSTKVLLNESIKNLGRVGDVVEVSTGHARNYLLPQGLAVAPTVGNLKKIEARRKEIERIERERKEKQAVAIKKLVGVEITLERRCNEQGHLFGSVSATEIAKVLQNLGHPVEADDVLLPGKLDKIDKFDVVVKFADDLKTDIKVWVAPDPDSKAAMEAARKAEPAAE